MDLHIKDVLNNYIEGSKITKGYYRVKIEEYWNQNMSNGIVDLTQYILFRNGVVTIRINSAPLKNELFNSRSRIKELLNIHLEKDIVTEVIIK